MKKIINYTLTLLVIIFILGCDNTLTDPESNKQTDKYTFINNSTYDITVSKSSGSDNFNSFTIKPTETESITLTGEYWTTLYFSYTNNELVEYSKVGRTITFTDIPWATYKKYLTITDYNTLLDKLETKPLINRSIIDSELELLNVRQDYDYSYYDGSSANCYSVDFESYNSETYDWNYYIHVDIWVDETGKLDRSMCNYYEG